MGPLRVDWDALGARWEAQIELRRPQEAQIEPRRPQVPKSSSGGPNRAQEAPELKQTISALKMELPLKNPGRLGFHAPGGPD